MAPPAAPSNLVATAISSSRIDLTWDDNSSDETKFELERSLNGTTGWAEIAEPAANAESYSDTPLPANAQRFYRIRAVNLDGNSDYSAVANATTELPGKKPLAPRLYLHNPDVVLAARVNWSSASYPLDFFDVDGVTSGSVAAVKAGMTLLLGTTAGADNLGRQRIRLDGSGARLFVGRSSQGTHDGELTVTDDAFVTVLDDRRVWAKIPFIAADGTIYKDSDLEVGTNTTTPPPVANCGAGFAATIDPDTSMMAVNFNGQNSFATADGASISSYLWDIGDGDFLSGSVATDSEIGAEFPAGFRYISLTVTDSNGKTHTAYAPVYARDPANDTSFDEFVLDSHRITTVGQQISVRILADAPRITYPDGTLAMIWESEPSGIGDRDHMLIIGWLDNEPAQMQAGRTGLLRDTTLTIIDVAGRLDRLPGLPQTLADDTTRDTDELPSITWNYMTTPNLDKYLHYLLHWHSTALELADFIWSDTGDEFEFVLLASDGQSLWAQVDQRARAFLPDFALTCDRTGRILIVPDPMLRDSADRTSEVMESINENEWSDIRYVWQRSPRTHWLRSSAILAGTSDPIETVFSIAPGDTPGQGVGEITQGEQLAASQTALNAATGHRYARANNPLGLLSITLVQDDGAPGTLIPWRLIEPAHMEWVTLTVSSETAAQRGLTFSSARFLCKEVNIRYNHGRTGMTRTVELLLEQETTGTPGKTVTKPDVPAVGDQPPPPTSAPDFGLTPGQQSVAGIGLDGFVYRTTDFQTVSGSGGPTWTRVDTGIADTIYSWVVDPFSPGYIAGSGAINGWIVNDTAIYRVTDLFGTPAATAQHTFATATSGASFHWRTIQASFGRFFATEANNPWLLCISYYGDTAGHSGTWATFSIDAGATWSTEVQISAHYDPGHVATARFQPIGVYTSPKTPGLAYTCAYIETAYPALADGFVSTDWGETWSRVSGDLVDDPDEPLPYFALVNENDLEPSDVAAGGRYGFTSSASATDASNVTDGQWYVLMAPPINAVRVTLQASYYAIRQQNGSAGSTITHSLNQKNTSPTHSRTDDLSFTQPAQNSFIFDSYNVEWTTAAADWPFSRDVLLATPPDGSSISGYCRFLLRTVASSISPTTTGFALIAHSARITEIELDDATVYEPPVLGSGFVQPGHGQSGSIHIPWPDNAAETLAYYGYQDRLVNREFRLHKRDGGTTTDISPSDGTRSYGVNRGLFTIRAFDSNRQYLLLAGIGNDTSSDPANDMHAVYVSDDFGATWTNIVTPEADSNAPAGRASFEAAFSGTSEQVIYVWGKASYIGYSSDFGATIDSRAGNLSSSFSASAFIGIAGGPTA